MSAVRQRIDRYQMPNGEEKTLPCVCDEYTLCLWHYAQSIRIEQAKNQEAHDVSKKKLEGKDARVDRSAYSDDSPRGGGRPDTAVRGDRRGKGEGPARAVRKPGRKR